MKVGLFSTIVLIIILSGSYWLRIYKIESKPVWYDETVSISHAEKPLQFYLTSFRVSYKPVYFFLLNLWVDFFGENTFDMRFFSVIWGVLNIFILFKLSRLIFDLETALISTFLFSISVFHIFQCQQIRHFSFLTFLATLSIYYLAKYCRNGRVIDLLFLTLINILIINTYPSGFFIIFLETIYGLVYMRGRDFQKWALAQVILTIFIFRWILVTDLHHMVEMSWWMENPGFSAIMEAFHTFVWGGPRYGLDDFRISASWMGPMWLLSFIYSIMLLYGLHEARSDRKNLFLITIWLIMPIGAVYAYSVFSNNSVFAIKHLIISLPAFYIIVALGISRLSTIWKVLLLVAIPMLNVLPLSHMYHNYFSTDWQSSTEYLKQHIKSGDIVIISTLSEVVTFMYYFDKKKRTLEDVDIYGRITNDNYQNEVFYTAQGNMVIGIQQTGFGNKSVTTLNDFTNKMTYVDNLKEGVIWTMLSRWSVPDIRDIIFPFLQRDLRKTICFNFQGVEVCRFAPVANSP